jgi:inositol 1,4,5-triphosphate receptor type 1
MKNMHEYWRYIKDSGVMYFLVCVYDEIKDRVDMDKSDEQSLADEFSIIKNNIQKMKEIFKVLE